MVLVQELKRRESQFFTAFPGALSRSQTGRPLFLQLAFQ
jgi:hypothetical protein